MNSGEVSTIAARLTPRQKQVLSGIANGYALKEIADALGIARHTAEYHQQRIRAATGIPDTANLTKFAVRAGLVPLDPQ